MTSRPEISRPDTSRPDTSRKRLFIKTYGCQMNVYDSDRMADLLAPLGWSATDSPETADLVILNTCHIREKASEKVYSELGRLKQIRTGRQQQGQDMLVAVAGCVAQAEGAEIMRRAPVVDMVFGPQSYHNLPEMVARASRAGGRVLDVSFPEEPKFDYLPAQQASGEPSAFLSVQEGCDKFCTFCVVPYTRGAEYSRPSADVLADARRLVDGGVVEITLIGQNVNAYHGLGEDGASVTLAGLMHALAAIPGLRRLRYTTSHPRDMGDDLIAAHGALDKLMPFLHLPIQSGSDRILAAMNRGHRAEEFLRIAERLKKARPDLKLSSDFIVGFPGETEADFQATLDLVREVGFIQAYSFKYSARPGTPAAAMDDQVDEAVKTERLSRLQILLNEQQQAFNRNCVGQEVPVLLDRPGRHPGQLAGRSPHMQPVQVAAPTMLKGQIVTAEILQANPNSLTGRIVGETKERDCA